MSIHNRPLVEQPPTTAWAFRAELGQDVDKFFYAMSLRRMAFGAKVYVDSRFPERHVEMHVDTDIETLFAILRTIEDSHLMLETLRPGTMKDGELPRHTDRK